MPRTLSYTDKALADLEAAEVWLTQPGSGPAAWAKLDAILSAIEGLRDHPCRWPLGRHPGVRERLCDGGWRAFYEVDPDTGRDETAGDVRVLRVYGRPRAGSPRVSTFLAADPACPRRARGGRMRV